MCRRYWANKPVKRNSKYKDIFHEIVYVYDVDLTIRDSSQVKAELTKMVNNGIIKQTSNPTQVVSPMVVIKQKGSQQKY